MAFFSKNKNKDHLSDLMVLSQKGDKKAYAQLLEEIQPILKAYLSKRLNEKEDVEDLVQVCLLAVHNSRHSYISDQPFENWLFGIARYKLMDFLRTYYKKNDNELTNSFVVETFGGTTTNSNQREAKHDLEVFLDQLPEKQRDIVKLLKIQGYSVKEVAKKLDMSESNVKVTMHRAMKDLETIAENEIRTTA
ncbi:MAG: RNA polymerase subunit sigma-24 [Rickettsiales bacterium]|nr:RNA polymerase subunit sigma-24 [Rickettsiales bacterium]|tara:strand:- start:112 stop:687 length:576 start_codon:yes stop_codon:yes gene_type:complete